MAKDRVVIQTKSGASRVYTVNKNGSVNANCKKFMKNNGGNVSLGTPVLTPVKCSSNGCHRG